jgi:hypothetical protein
LAQILPERSCAIPEGGLFYRQLIHFGGHQPPNSRSVQYMQFLHLVEIASRLRLSVEQISCGGKFEPGVCALLVEVV